MTGRNRRCHVIVVMVTVIVVGVSCAGQNKARTATRQPTPSVAPSSTSPPPTAPSTTAPVPRTTAPTTSRPSQPAPGCVAVSGWNDSRLAAETITVPTEETDLATVDTEIAGGAGGVILFGTSAPADLGAQIANLESLVPGRLGLLVMTDEEGGGIQRMANLVGNLPWASYLGTYWTPAQITRQVASVARNMAAIGVNVDLAPVADVDGRNVAPGALDPDGWRSFSGNTSVVTQDAIAFMNGLIQGGVLPVLKHFPGLGGSTGNTDNGAAATLAWPTLQQTAIPPFAEAIEDGAPAVMVSNATVPSLTTLPASLSGAVIQQQLVGALHFGGLIVTDSLSADAISAAGYTTGAAAVQALRAGADLIIYSTMSSTASTVAQFQAIVAAVTSAVSAGTLPRGRLIAAAGTVLKAHHVPVC